MMDYWSEAFAIYGFLLPTEEAVKLAVPQIDEEGARHNQDIIGRLDCSQLIDGQPKTSIVGILLHRQHEAVIAGEPRPLDIGRLASQLSDLAPRLQGFATMHGLAPQQPELYLASKGYE